jgi:predicted Zn-dependent protease
VLDALERMLAAGKDSAMLRFSLGNEYLKQGDATTAVMHLEQAVAQDPVYSAAWKQLGRAREAAGDRAGAKLAWEHGIEVATARGDQQAAREMGVFLRRLSKSAPPG